MKEERIICGDSLEVLKTLPDESVDCVITSPPYFGLRDYGVSGQIGLEETPEMYVQSLSKVFNEVKRVLKKEGTFWLNLGDSYWANRASNGQSYDDNEVQRKRAGGKNGSLKPKDIIGIPWRVAFALQADGWYLRQDIIWAKPNPMPESVTDRCTKSHEYIFLLSKSPKYYFDNEAIREPNANPERTNYTPGSRSNGENKDHNDNDFAERVKAKTLRPYGVTRNRALAYDSKENAMRGIPEPIAESEHELPNPSSGRNKRSVWTVTTKPFKEAHFATFPEALIEPMVLAGCPKGGVVLDPFFGAGTTGVIAKKLGRNYLGIELNPEYIKIAEKRINGVSTPLL